MATIAADEPTQGYLLRPNQKQKFRPAQTSKLIEGILHERLQGTSYHPDTCSQWTREIADEIKNALKALELPRYKFVVTVSMGELRGEGVRMGARCFWDGDTDQMAQHTFVNDSLFCVAVAYGVFYY